MNVCSDNRRTRFLILLVTLFAVGCGSPGDTDAETEEDEHAQPRVVVVDWLGRGQLYAASVVDERQGMTGVRYADGDREWVEPSRIRPWPELVGRQIQVWIRHTATTVTVLERRGSLFHVRFEDAADTWVSADMLYGLSASEVGGGHDNPDRPTFPDRVPVDPSSLRPGIHVLTERPMEDNSYQGLAFVAEINGIEGDEIRVRFRPDGPAGVVRPQDIVRILEGGASAGRGDRVWLGSAAPLGTILETRAGLVHLAVGETDQWLEQDEVLAPAPAIDAERLTQGAHVTAVWGGSSLYYGTVQTVRNGQATLRWHEGSPPSEVAVASIVEVWDAAP